MNRRSTWWLACAAVGSGLACRSEVTVELLRNATEADAGGDASAEAGDVPSPPAPPCQKLGPEVCNGGDDDCNGLVDEGCAYTVAWTRAPDGVALGHATGGVAFQAPCPDGAVLTGLVVGMGAWLNQVVAVCHQLELHVDATQTPVAFSASLGPRFDLPFAPAQSTDPSNKVEDLLCPDGLVITGADGTTTTDAARYILGVRLTCATPLVIMTGAGAVLDADRLHAQMVGPVVCATCAPTQELNVSATIEPGQIATSLFGGDGLWVDRVGVGASQGSIVPR